jgi:hypothetical protein
MIAIVTTKLKPSLRKSMKPAHVTDSYYPPAKNAGKAALRTWVLNGIGRSNVLMVPFKKRRTEQRLRRRPESE